MEQVFPLFSTPIFQSEIKVDSSIKEQLINEKFKLIDVENNGEYSEDFFVLKKYQSLKTQIDIAVDRYVHNILQISKKITFNLQNSWITKQTPNSQGLSHCHSNSIISGVLYLKTPDNSGRIVFVKHENQPTVAPPFLSIPFDEYNLYNSNSWYVEPKEDMILLFPSHIFHGIDKNKSTENRYSLSFNYFIKGTLKPNTIGELVI